MEARRVSEGRMRKDSRLRVGLPKPSTRIYNLVYRKIAVVVPVRDPWEPHMKSRLAVAFVVFHLLLTSTSAQAQEITAAPTKTSGIYEPGEKIEWKVEVKGAKDVTQLAYTVKKN